MAYLVLSLTTPTGTATVNVLNTTTLFPGHQGALAHFGVSRFVVDVNHDEAFTFKWYRSDDKGATWVQQGEEAISAPSGATDTTARDFFVEDLLDWKLDVTNGGSDQTVWDVHANTVHDRSPAA